MMIASMNPALLVTFYWVMIFFLIALLTALCGFGAVAAFGAIAARVLFVGLIVVGALSRIPTRRQWHPTPR